MDSNIKKNSPSMQEEARQIFAQTISSDNRKRQAAESALMSLEDQPGFVMSLPQTCMKDNDNLVRRASSIYFKNTVIKKWKSGDYVEVKKYLIANIFELFIQANDVAKASYHSVIVHILNSEKTEDLKEMFHKAAEYMKGNSIEAIYAALTLYVAVFEAEKMKYNLEPILELLFNTAGTSILEKLHSVIEAKNYKLSRMIIHVLGKSYNYYSIPDFLSDLNVFSYFFEVCLQVLNTKTEENEDFLKAKSAASYFLYKASNKATKRFYKKNELSDYVTNSEKFRLVYTAFSKVINERPSLNYGETGVEIELNALDFLVMVCSDTEFFKYAEGDIFYYITNYILPLHAITKEEEEDFEVQPDKYLREKYNFFTLDLKTAANSLFYEIFKRIKKNEEAVQGILNYFVSVMDAYKSNPTEENARLKYGVIYLLSTVVTTLSRQAKPFLGHIITNYIFPDLNGGNIILRSQACYFLSFIEEENIVNDDSVLTAMSYAHSLMQSEYDALKVDATLSNMFFLNSWKVADKFRQMIPEIVKSILKLSSTYDIEALTMLLDSIIAKYPNDIAIYAPELAGSISKLALSHLMNEASADPAAESSEDKLMLISGFMRTIENLVLSLNVEGPALSQAFANCYELLSYILKNTKADFIQEALDLINGFVYTEKNISPIGWDLLYQVLNLPEDEIFIYPSEISDLIDNFVSYGKNNIFNANVLDKIYAIITQFSSENDDSYYDEDFISACKIVETLVLNIGDELVKRDPSRLEFFISTVVSNFELLDESSTSMIYGIELIMNCFILRPKETLQILESKNFLSKFLETLFSLKNRFTRVHDKKICTLFLGTLSSLPEGTISVMSISELSRFMVTIVTTLPTAIKNRNAKKDESKKRDEVEDEAESSSGYHSSSEYNDEDLEEDIYFESSLDGFEPFGYIASIFSNSASGTYGSAIIRNMTEEQKNAVANVLNNERIVQKV